MQRNDTLWKGLIENIFPWFIPFFLPEYQHLFDAEGGVEFLDKELQQLYPQEDGPGPTRFVDKLVRVQSVEGKEHWLLIHIEVQGYNDTEFARRMFTYFSRILDRYGVPVTAVAILTDSNATFEPRQYQYDFAGTKNFYQFNTYKVLHQQQELLEQSNNPFAIAILTVLLALQQNRLPDDDLLRLKVDLYKKMRQKEFSVKIIRSLFNFIKLYVNFEKPEMRTKFDNEILQLTNQKQTMGLEEQILEMFKQEGRVEGKAEGEAQTELKKNKEFVTNLLLSTEFDNDKIAMLAGVPVAFVEQIEKEVKR